MVKVSIPKTEYVRLKRESAAYRSFAAKFFEEFTQDPIGEVVEDFRKTALYTKEFLADLESGLRKSSYLKLHGDKTSKKRLAAISYSP